MRLTRDVREALLRLNEGFETSTHYNAKNATESRNYKIVDGQLQFRARGKTSWADSRYDNPWVADDAATHRFLRENLGGLNDEGLSDTVASLAAERASSQTSSGSVPAPAPAYPSVSTPTIPAAPGTSPSGTWNVEKVAVWVGVALVVVNAGVASAPGVTRLWREQVGPRAKRLRGKLTKARPVETADRDEYPDGRPDPTPDIVQ